MSEKPALLMVGSLPPFESAAAALCLHTANALSQHFEITCVIDDLAPPAPAELGFSTIRFRELVAGVDTYQVMPRLFIIGDEGDSLFALELLEQAPGIVVPASLSLHNLAEPVCRAKNSWPDAYWRWLHENWPDAAATLFSARVFHRRQSSAQGLETPAFDLLLEHASALVAPSERAATALTASGLEPDLTLPFAPAAPQVPEPKAGPAKTILFIGQHSGLAAQVADQLAPLPIASGISCQVSNMTDQALVNKIAQADTVVFADNSDDAACPAFSIALALGKAIITAGQPWTAGLPADCRLDADAPGSVEKVIAAIGALATLNGWKEIIERQALTTFSQEDPTAALVRLIKQVEPGSIGAIADKAHRPTLPKEASAQLAVSDGPAFEPPPITEETSSVALVGAVPPAGILGTVLPSLDIANCPRFATPALAGRLANIARDDPATLLARMGFEAPIVAAEGDLPECHRDPVALANLMPGLKAARAAAAFSCKVAGAIDGASLLRHHLETVGGKTELAIAIEYVDKGINTVRQGFLASSGLFWSHDEIRHTAQCIAMVGAGANLRLRAGSDCAYMVANADNSCLIDEDQSALLQADELGLVDFRLLALDPQKKTPLQSEDLRKQLAESGLILEWSVS